ncbi:MAG TPA: tetratricopeptide repeat protein [Puia sp.]|jgi:tetratricopeptide (TPR) repeat protein|nr:tetratricopeptide repeat protein [Puia sp.]
MKKPQFILAGSGALLLILVFFFGETIPPKKKNVVIQTDSSTSPAKSVTTQDVLNASKAKLTPFQLSYVNSLEHSVVRGDVKNQEVNSYTQLANFWRDSVRDGFLAYAYYIGETAKLENSEKKLTFAAQLFLENLRGQDDAGLKIWMADNAKQLFEKSLQLNPNNDSSKVGLGACYIFGSSAGSPQEVMQGIQRILEVANRDTTNMYAQFMLGLGGEMSGQFDKAIERLTKVIQHEPENVEAILTLAEINEKKGNKKEAVKWYNDAKRFINDEKIIKEINERIKLLQ